MSVHPLDQNAKTFDIKGFTLSINYFCILIQRVMPVYENYNVIAFKSCIQKFTVYTTYHQCYTSYLAATDYECPMKPFLIGIQTFWIWQTHWTDKFLSTWDIFGYAIGSNFGIVRHLSMFPLSNRYFCKVSDSNRSSGIHWIVKKLNY